ncbi:MAG: hypothetical protein QNK33_00205 [Bacteroidales bacterium]|nr:hypothetical protein [Bacteroidales bacterium]
MKKHVSFVAALHIGFGILGIIGAIVTFFIMNFATSFVEDVDVAENVMRAIMIILPLFIGLGSTLGIIGGIGLFGYHQWARILVIVLSALNCLSVPIGTVKGVYSIWALLQDETISLFNKQNGVTTLN